MVLLFLQVVCLVEILIAVLVLLGVFDKSRPLGRVIGVEVGMNKSPRLEPLRPCECRIVGSVVLTPRILPPHQLVVSED